MVVGVRRTPGFRRSSRNPSNLVIFAMRSSWAQEREGRRRARASSSPSPHPDAFVRPDDLASPCAADVALRGARATRASEFLDSLKNRRVSSGSMNLPRRLLPVLLVLTVSTLLGHICALPV